MHLCVLFTFCSACWAWWGFTVWSRLPCRKHFRRYLGELATCRLHSIINVKQILLPYTLLLMYLTSILLDATRRQNVWSVRIFHVKMTLCRSLPCVVNPHQVGTMWSIDANMSRTVSWTHHLTWELLTNNTLQGRAAWIWTDDKWMHDKHLGNSFCNGSIIGWSL